MKPVWGRTVGDNSGVWDLLWEENQGNEIKADNTRVIVDGKNVLADNTSR